MNSFVDHPLVDGHRALADETNVMERNLEGLDGAFGSEWINDNGEACRASHMAGLASSNLFDSRTCGRPFTAMDSRRAGLDISRISLRQRDRINRPARCHRRCAECLNATIMAHDHRVCRFRAVPHTLSYQAHLFTIVGCISFRLCGCAACIFPTLWRRSKVSPRRAGADFGVGTSDTGGGNGRHRAEGCGCGEVYEAAIYA